MPWYHAYTLALIRAAGDSSAIRTLVGQDPAGALRWAPRARSELRMSLWRGQVETAKKLTELIHEVEIALQSKGQRWDHDEGALDITGMAWLLNAVKAAASGDCWSSREQLARTGDSQTAGRMLRWLADLWRGRVEATLGDIESAEEVLARARTLAEGLDEPARQATNCVLAEVEAQADEVQLALERVDAAVAAFEQMGDPRWLAAAWLTRARILDSRGFDVESTRAAERAHQADPEWAAPVLLLARRALEKGVIDEAERRLLLVTPRTEEISRELALLGRVRDGDVPLWAASEYLALRDAPPTEAGAGQLRALVAYHPNFIEAQTTLAWAMLHLQTFDEAEKVFRELLAHGSLDAPMRLSVLNGLECAVAMRRQSELMNVAIRPPEATQTKEVPIHAISSSESVTKETPAVMESPEALSGELSLLSLPELLEFLRGTRRTGVLALSSEDGSGSLCLFRGMLVAASSPAFPSPCNIQLGEPESKPAPNPVGEEGPQTPEEADIQIRGAVREFLGWRNGRFAFQPHGRCDVGGLTFALELDPQQVLMEAMEF